MTYLEKVMSAIRFDESRFKPDEIERLRKIIGWQIRNETAMEAVRAAVLSVAPADEAMAKAITGLLQRAKEQRVYGRSNVRRRDVARRSGFLRGGKAMRNAAADCIGERNAPGNGGAPEGFDRRDKHRPALLLAVPFL